MSSVKKPQVRPLGAVKGQATAAVESFLTKEADEKAVKEAKKPVTQVTWKAEKMLYGRVLDFKRQAFDDESDPKNLSLQDIVTMAMEEFLEKRGL